MKTFYLKYSLFFLLFNLFFVNAFSQGLTDENTALINQYFQSNKDATLVVPKTNTFTNENQSQINLVEVNQVGNENQVDIKSNANNSQVVIQKGDQNYYNFINYYNNNPSNFNILQQGESNSLQIYGQNSIIENISIIQNSSFKTLIIKNY